MIAPSNWEEMARVGATGLADSAVVGTGIALLACILTSCFHKRSAATRFSILMAALVATASLPLLRLVVGGTAQPSQGAFVLRISDSWAAWILGVWASIAGLTLARVAAGIWSLTRLRRSCRKLQAPDAGITAAIAQYCPRRRVEVLLSDKIAVPAAIGFFRPAVVLPDWVLEEMSADEMRQVVIHELSHLRRHDDWTNLLQQIVKALFFFHPAVWWMESRLSLEREMACDDAVLARSENPRGYAECLARIAERSLLRRSLAMAQAAVSRVRQTSQRVARILQFEASAGARPGRLSVGFAALFAIICTGALWHAPQVISFDTLAPSPLASLNTASAPGPVAPALQQVAAAHLEPHKPVARKSRTAPPREERASIQEPAVPQLEPPMLQASMSMEEGRITRSVLVVVMQNEDRIAVWQITTWQYSPSRQVRSARKTT